MKKVLGITFLGLALLATAHKSIEASDLNKIYHVRLETDKGNIELEVDGIHAPVSTQNFLKYVTKNLYSGGSFFRTVTMANQPDNQIKIEVIQAGPEKQNENAFPPIALEKTSVTGIHHFNGTLSMARNGPDTATSNFFICIHDQPELDFGGKRNPDGQGFAAFGHVTSGMDIVDLIQTSPAQGQTLTPPIQIKHAVVY
jgi:peptidyl-prolyl cis-trans isomerase A (cyclophilin A)